MEGSRSEVFTARLGDLVDVDLERASCSGLLEHVRDLRVASHSGEPVSVGKPAMPGKKSRQGPSRLLGVTVTVAASITNVPPLPFLRGNINTLAAGEAAASWGVEANAPEVLHRVSVACITRRNPAEPYSLGACDQHDRLKG